MAQHQHACHAVPRVYAPECVAHSDCNEPFRWEATDFGTGFYTTTRLDQAEEWARRQFVFAYPNRIDPLGLDAPAVVKFRVPLDAMAALHSVAFVRGESTHAAFWSFVNHCRASKSHDHPSRPKPGDWYDIAASGPVAKLPLANRVVLGTYNGHEWAGMDQFSFHTPAAAKVLNSIDRTDPTEFEMITLKP